MRLLVGRRQPRSDPSAQVSATCAAACSFYDAGARSLRPHADATEPSTKSLTEPASPTIADASGRSGRQIRRKGRLTGVLARPTSVPPASFFAVKTTREL